MASDNTEAELLAEIEELKARLGEAEDAIRAIQQGEVDALVVQGPEGEQLYTLRGAEHVYRLLVEAMNEGALVLTYEGDIAYCNRTLAAMLNVPLERITGTSIFDYVEGSDAEAIGGLLDSARHRSGRAEVELKVHGIVEKMPANISIGSLELDEAGMLSAVVTDLTEHKRTESELEQYREHLEELVVQRTRELMESNRRTESILESIGDGFCSFDREWRYTYVNSRAEQILGLSREELLGHSVWDLYPEQVGRPFHTACLKAAASGETCYVETYNEIPGLWIENRCYPVASGVSVYFSDITERKLGEIKLQELSEELASSNEELHTTNDELAALNDELSSTNSELRLEVEERRAAEAELQAQKDMLSAVADNTLTQLAYLDRDFTFVWVNPSYARSAGRAQEEFAGHNHFEFYPHAENQAIFEQVRDTGTPFEVKEKPFEFPDHPEWGTTYWDWTLTPISGSDGNTSHLVLSLVDVTERKRIEQEQADLLRREQHIASMLQQSLVPPEVPREIGGHRFAVTYRPALKEAEVGGDFYDVFDLGDGRVCVMIGDVAGKGLPAAIRVAAARYAIRSYAYIETRPTRILTLANASLCCSDEEHNMLTAFLAILDTRLSTLIYSNAGHEPPMLVHPDGRATELFTPGTPLGFWEQVNYLEDTCLLEPGSRIVMLTDGITEARRPGVELYEKERAMEYVVENRELPIEDLVSGLLQSATDFAGGQLQDDAAIVVIERPRP